MGDFYTFCLPDWFLPIMPVGLQSLTTFSGCGKEAMPVEAGGHPATALGWFLTPAPSHR